MMLISSGIGSMGAFSLSVAAARAWATFSCARGAYDHGGVWCVRAQAAGSTTVPSSAADKLGSKQIATSLRTRAFAEAAIQNACYDAVAALLRMSELGRIIWH
eukprot:2462312-Pleurochrysis_carterae.AAC.2